MKFRKTLPLLLCLLLLLSGCSLERLLAMETHEANPVSPRTTALVFGGREANGPVWVVTDGETIAALRDSYRWTHSHMLCCLEGAVSDYVDFYEGSRIVPWELSKHKLYADDVVLAYNAAFRHALRAARESALPMQRTLAYADTQARAAQVEAALPGCIVAISERPAAQGLEMHILTPGPLTEAQLQALQALPGVTLP